MGSKIVEYIDPNGRYFRVSLPDNCTDPSLGHIIGPPVVGSEALKLEVEEILSRLHNELYVRGLFTARDMIKPGAMRLVTEAKRAALDPIISVADIVSAYEEEQET